MRKRFVCGGRPASVCDQSLIEIDERPHARLIAGKRRGMIISLRREFSGKNVAAHQREAGALAGTRRWCIAGVSDQSDAAAGPVWHLDLRDFAKIDIGRRLQTLQKTRNLPLIVLELLNQQRFLLRGRHVAA